MSRITRRNVMRKLMSIAVSGIVGLAVAIAVQFLPARSSSAQGSVARFLAAPVADTVFLIGPIDGVGGEGKVVRCKDDGTYWRCAEVKNAGRSQ